jgi:hypothetical protein
MNALRLRFAGIVGLIALIAPAVQAQPVPPSIPQRPAFSPYLNLLRGGNPGLNYYGLVRPQLQLNEQYGQLQSRLNQFAREADQQDDPFFGAGSNANRYNPYLPLTGYVARFDDLGGYFNRLGGGGSSTFGSSGGSSILSARGGMSGIQPSFAGRSPAGTNRFMGGFGGQLPGGQGFGPTPGRR